MVYLLFLCCMLDFYVGLPGYSKNRPLDWESVDMCNINKNDFICPTSRVLEYLSYLQKGLMLSLQTCTNNFV